MTRKTSSLAQAAAQPARNRAGARTGQLLVDALQASPHPEIEIEPRRSALPVRAVKP